ncbi:MAG TPA: phage portal protein [Gammaproteobacteria bacterium]|nr:phage portal protein [Gammaproteobacteria bacterium]
MNLNPLTWFSARPLEAKTDMSLDTLIQRLEAAYRTGSGVVVTPESCMQSPTVNAIVTSVSRRLSVSPVRVMRRTYSDKGRERKELLPSHPVAKLLARPNSYQTRASYWLDAGSVLMRYGRYFAVKGQGNTGPIRRLHPLVPAAVEVDQDDLLEPVYRATFTNGERRDIAADEMHHVRGAARDFLTGDSPVVDVREAIALEIAMEKYGASFFGNGTVPLLIFTLMQGFQDFKSTAERDSFLNSVREQLTGSRAHSAFMLPKGIDVKDMKIENEKAQFIEARKYQRTVIAGAFGVPPHFVGDLERATFNNVEQQDTDFVINVVMPVAQTFEAAMERDLLTDDDRRDGVIIRFNLDAIQRADFKARQEGSRVQRDAGVINANDWRERENLNPISEDDGGEDYIRPANMVVAGDEPPPKEPGNADTTTATDV